MVTLTAGLVAAFVLFLVFRAAQARISRQTDQLVEATRRDPLTDTPNHGSLVTALAAAVETARTAREPIAIALLDIDNFRLLNDTHGHPAGDQAILTLAELLGVEFPTGAILGRYGPDEFLVIEPSVDVQVLEQAIERLRSGARGPGPRSSGSSEVAAGHDQRRHLRLPRARELRHRPPVGGGDHPPGGEEQRRRRGPDRPAPGSRSRPRPGRSTSTRA